MKYSHRYAAVVLSFALAMSPALAMAQTASTTPAADVGTTPTQQQMMRGWWQSSGIQQSVAALGSTPVQSLPMPVLFGVALSNITPNFGDPRPGGRTHEGEDIMAVKGTPVVSPTDAVVLHLDTGVDEGNAVYTANPGGETFVYMHLDRFAEGVTSGTVLHVGSLIGYVGNTGNASGGAAHLHFEVHNSAGVPTDPFPRLTAEFTPAQKISFLTTIFGQTSDPVALSVLLVTNFRTTFTDDAQSGITLPPLIVGALASVAVTPPTSGSLPAGDLMLGSSGSAVVSLQQFLIAKATGPAATRLAGAGATGNFGPITEAALIEYQSAVGISPANGYYGPATRAAVQAAPVGNIGTPTGNTTTLPGSTSGSGTGVLVITGNLYYGVSGEDVRTLQKLLNAHGYTVASSGPGSYGNETTYFGPATLAAVIKFQTARSISPAVGYVGPLTRAALATL